MARIVNFSAGPAVMPEEVLAQARDRVGELGQGPGLEPREVAQAQLGGEVGLAPELDARRHREESRQAHGYWPVTRPVKTPSQPTV